MSKLSDALTKAGLQLYRQESYNHKRDAQRNLQGRTHYADDDTLRSFKARIVSASASEDGSYYYLIESVALDSDNRERGFRFVVFDVFGAVIIRSQLDEAYSTSEKARKAMWSTINAFDFEGHYRARLVRRAARLEEEAHALRVAQEALS